MSKTYSKSELEELAKPVFKNNPKVDSLHATRDGQFFLPSKLFAAYNHSVANGGLEIYILEKEAKKQAPKKEENKNTKNN